MSLLCQKNSYLQEYQSPVRSCQPSSLNVNGKHCQGFDIVLEDSIFFPEGGGQPYDTGLLDDQKVINVRRDGNQAILFVEGDHCRFDCGHQPLQKIDWNRRFDHMQQHSGQHLITAVALKYFNLLTTSWNLGAEISNIELDSTQITDETIEQLEQKVNEKILENLPITISYRDKDDLADIRQQMELPDDLNAHSLRIVSIESLDKNPCCGTHVSSLSHLQMIKLLGTQKGKKGKTLLFFLSGNRVLKHMNNILVREKLLSTSLKCTAEEFVPIVDKLQKNVRRLQKNCTSAMRDLARCEGEKYLNLLDKPRLYSIHRKECEYDFVTSFFNTIGDPTSIIGDRLILISLADDCNSLKSPGQIVIAGNQLLVEKSAKIAIDSFDAKGSVSSGRFRARIPDVSKLPKFEQMITKQSLMSNEN
ncbi:alanyl-tRNA editing protein Aarsd1-A [Dermatophagoides farinae]|uniref:Alanyl-tRNA editing protein Aarsd1, variant 2 n=1 Tax=Dermatophagoides farinae TaxID=6954 RepID=A0A922IEN7_DERFA|nr:alanyl-tRNA editing protein Aarsd1-A-like [Dermatophagoides farinae]KAH7642755.1 alanyl-trna synthetase-like protein [Dermatophagoides farinae]KAH9530131.1 Alanyl-tRNA editing protein Aarsd1, variant 2 [Dermatophagoides farinae]